MIYSREIHQVQVVDFQRMPELMRDGLFARMVMEHRDDARVVVFTSRAWGRLFDTREPLVWELILEFLSTLRFGEFNLALGLHTGEEMESLGFARYWSESERMIPRKGDLHDYWSDISTTGDFLGPPHSYTLIRGPVLRLCHRMMAHSIAGRSQAPEKILQGLTVIAPTLLVIDMDELMRLQICMEIDDTWAWVALGPERQPDAAASAPEAAEDAPVDDEGGKAVLGLRRDVGSLHGLVERSMTDQGRFSTWMISCMTQLMEASGLTYQAFDETFHGSSPAAF
ncbi:hypothetical protein Tco_1349241 [Tanacetum coccineum]